MAVFVTIVLDGVGIGAQEDARKFGDFGADTLGHVCSLVRPTLPNLCRWGLGNIRPLEGIPPAIRPVADFGRMREVSAGKDSTTGHWELAGIQLQRPFPTYPEGFPEDLLRSFLALTGQGGWLGNEAASGTEIITRLGERHQATGWPIVYTSADSVFQVAAHVDVVPLPALYELCRIAREKVCVREHAVGRVIARPFQGEQGNYTRISSARKDFSLRPPETPVQSRLRAAGVHTIAVGKVGDLFDQVGFDACVKTQSNVEGVEESLRAVRDAAKSGTPTFVWSNLVDFDQEYGHRNDIRGFAAALEDFDAALPEIEHSMPAGSVLVLTADHGNDPSFPGTDHSREFVPLLVSHPKSGSDLGLRSTFADHAASVAAFFGCGKVVSGESFLPASVVSG